MSGKTKWLLIGIPAAILVFVLLGLGVAQWLSASGAEEDDQRLSNARQSLDSSDYESALTFFYKARAAGLREETRTAWQSIHVRALLMGEKIPELATAYGRDHGPLLGNEDASLAVYRFLMGAGYGLEADRLRLAWKGRETQAYRWLEADVTSLTARGMNKEARQLAEDAKLPDDREIDRLILLIRLADNGADRTELLRRASAMDVDNPKVRAARAFFLERNQQNRLALFEYEAAARNAPDDAEARHRLAEFLQRTRRSSDALSIWEGASAMDALAYLKTLAWSSLLRPPAAAVQGPPDIDPDSPYGRWKNSLTGRAQDQFIDLDSSPETAPEGLEQEVAWLRILETVRLDRHLDALGMLKALGSDQKSVNPVILRGLCQAMTQRVNGEPNASACTGPLSLEAGQTPQVSSSLDELEHAQKSLRQFGGEQYQDALEAPEMRATAALLESPDILPAVLLSGGWPEAALKFSPPSVSAAAWLQRLYLAALRRNRGPEATLAYLNRLPQLDDTLRVLQAELGLVIDTERDAALAALPQLAKLEGVAGVRAADLLARSLFEHGKANEALSAILSNQSFSASVPGHELAARIYLSAGDTQQARSVLTRIRPYSVYAREVLASFAWKEQRYGDAADLLSELLERSPEREDLRASLRQALDAEAKASKGEGRAATSGTAATN